jgi:hypothetical protein
MRSARDTKDAEDFRRELTLMYERARAAAESHPTLADELVALWRLILEHEIVFAVWRGEPGRGGHYYMPLKGAGLIRKTILEGMTLRARVSGVLCRDGDHASDVQRSLASLQKRPLTVVTDNGRPTNPAA